LSDKLPGNLAEILSLRLRLRKEFRFFQRADQVVAERVEDSQRFFVRRWQYEMFLRFDGKRTFEEAAKEVFQKEGGGFTAVGLLNFYRWLYQENLVLCKCDSVVELVGDDGETGAPVNSPNVTMADQEGAPRNQGRVKPLWNAVDDILPENPGMKQAIKVAAMVVFGLSALRLGFVTAPVFEPPVNRLYAEVGKFFYEDTRQPNGSESTRNIADSSKKEVQLAGRVDSPQPAAVKSASENSGLKIPDVTPRGSTEIGESSDSLAVSMAKIEDLRRRMSECRIRRDEFYIQNNEAGYRQEVEKMSALAKEIGEIESKL